MFLEADRMLLLDLPRGEMESEEETATGGTSSVFVWRGGAAAALGMLIGIDQRVGMQWRFPWPWGYPKWLVYKGKSH